MFNFRTKIVETVPMKPRPNTETPDTPPTATTLLVDQERTMEE